ncbi:MAG: hypothetical protein ACYCO9_09730 [Streptosporangiaceae bacterium]
MSGTWRSIGLARDAVDEAIRFYQNPPASGMTVETDWSDLCLSAQDWARAFDAVAPGTPHNEAREVIWAELLAILVDARDDDVPADLMRTSLSGNAGLRAALNRAWPLLWATDLVGDLWSVPAYLRRCAPWLSRDEVARLQRADAQAWTVADLPLLDAARQRLGDPAAARRERCRSAAAPGPVADPGTGQGTGVRPGRPGGSGGVRHRDRGNGRPLRGDDQGQ